MERKDFAMLRKAPPWGELSPVRATERGLQFLRLIVICTSQQILDTNHKKIYNKKFSVSQISVRNATCDIELASDSLTNKLDAVH